MKDAFIQQPVTLARTPDFPNEDTAMKSETSLVEQVFGSEGSLLRMLIDNLPGFVFVKDRQCRIIIANMAHARVLGASNPDDVAGRTDFDFFPAERARKYQADERAVMETGQAHDQEERFIDPVTGDQRWLHSTRNALRDASGTIIGLIGTCRDVTEQKKAQEALRRSNDELEQHAAVSAAELSERNAHLAALQETAMDLISQLDLDRLLENILKRAGQLMGTSTGFLDLLEPGEDHLTPKIALGVLAAESLQHHVHPGEGLAGKVWQTGQPILVEDYDSWSGRIQGHEENIIRSIIEIPLVSQSGFIGVLGLAHEKGSSGQFGPDSIEVLGKFARFATIAIENARLYSKSRYELAERKRTEEELRTAEALLHSVVEQMPNGLFRKDLEGRYVFVNPWFCRLKGVKPEEILGKTPVEFETYELNALGRRNVARPDKPATSGMSDHEHILKTGMTIDALEEYTTTDGTLHHLKVIQSPVFGPGGSITGTQGIMLDITDVKKAEAALANERLLLRTIIDNLPDAVYAKDIECRKMLVNPADLRILRCKTEADAIGKSDYDLFPPEIAAKFHADDMSVIGGQPVLNREEYYYDDDNRQHWLLTSKLPLRNPEGRIIGLVGIGRNITAVKEAERKVEALNRELMAASRQAGMAEVAIGVLHNIGNVLNSLNVSASLVDERLHNSRVESVSRLAALFREHSKDLPQYLTEEEHGRQIPKYLEELGKFLNRERTDMRQEVEVLKESINHIKEIVSMQQENVRIFGLVEPLQLADLVEDALKLNSAGYSRHGVTVQREFDPVPSVSSDKHKVLQILVNLISNAKYACDASPTTSEKKVVLRLKADGLGHVQIEVADDGIGIAPENLTRIFAQGFTTRKGGHGFGLHTSALTARELGGSLTVRSDGLGHGATFVLTLPVTPPSAASSEPCRIGVGAGG